MEPLELLLQLSHLEHHRYRLRVWQSDGERRTRDDLLRGAAPEVVLDPQDGAELELMHDPQAYGRWLGDALLADAAARSAINEGLRVAESHDRPVRFVLELPRSLQHLAWETLYLGGSSGEIATRPRLRFSRFLSSTSRRPPLRQQPEPLRVLVAVAAPAGLDEYNLLSPDPDLYLDLVRKALPETTVETCAATQETIVSALQEGFDIFCLVCHGQLNSNGQPFLLLENEDGMLDRQPAGELATAIGDLPTIPRHVLLISCFGSGDGRGDALNAAGPLLIDAGVPAVVSIRREISEGTARALLPQYLAEVARDGAVDRALALARRHVRERADAWAPVLFMRLTDGRLWSPAEARKAPFMAVSLPADYVERQEELEAARNYILQAAQDTDAKTLGITAAALAGAGGYGKTVLALALCHDEQVRAAFPDGILWTTPGESPSQDDLLRKLNELTTQLTGGKALVTELNAAQVALAEALGEKQVLLVVDDVWNEAHLRPFLEGGPKCLRLITTRQSRALPAGTEEILVEKMADDEAIQLLRYGLSGREEFNWAGLAERLGQWPLLLKLANGAIRDKVRDGLSLEIALQEIGEELTEFGLQAFNAAKPEERNQAVQASLGPSLNRLSNSARYGRTTIDERNCFFQLAAFPEDTDIPLSTLESLWEDDGLGPIATRRLTERLEDLSLILRFDREQQTIRLHDVIGRYLVEEAEAASRLLNYHDQLLAGYAAMCPDGWASGPDDGYFFQHLSYHLQQTRRFAELRRLLIDADWLQAKLKCSDVNALLADFAYLDGTGKDNSVRLIEGALRLSSHVLVKDPAQLIGQLWGRLQSIDYPEIQALLVDSKESARAPWLRPKSASLSVPGGQLLRIFSEHTDSVTAVALSADGRLALSGSADRTVRVWDLDQGTLRHTLEGHGDSVSAVALSADGRLALSGSLDGTMRLWDLDQGALRYTLEGHGDWVRAVVLSADGRLALSGSNDGPVRVWDLDQGALRHTLEGHGSSVNAVALSADGRLALSGSADRTVRVWDLDQGALRHTLEGHRTPVNDVALSADGRLALSGSVDRTMRVWDLDQGVLRHTLEGHKDSVNAVALSADGRLGLSGSADQTVRVWDLDHGALRHTLEGHGDWVSAVALSADGRLALSGAMDGTVRVWDLDQGALRHTLEGHGDEVTAVALSADGRLALSGSHDQTMRVWDFDQGALRHTLEGHGHWISAVALSADGHLGLSGSADKTVRVWDLNQGSLRHTLKGHGSWVRAVALSADGRLALSGSWDQTVRVWDLNQGALRHTLEGHEDWVNAVALSADGRLALSGSADQTVRVWDLDQGALRYTLEGHGASVNAVALSADGRLALSGSNDRTVRVWDLDQGSLRLSLEGHGDWVNAVALSIDGRLALSGSKDRTVRVWDLARGTILAIFEADSPIACVALSPDDRRIVAGDGSGKMHFLALENLTSD